MNIYLESLYEMLFYPACIKIFYCILFFISSISYFLLCQVNGCQLFIYLFISKSGFQCEAKDL